MKTIAKGNEPLLLSVFRQRSPNGTWEKFRKNTERRHETQACIRAEQGNLCAYCEVDMKRAPANMAEDSQSDFRVEHFHPKSDKTTSHNWALDWQNMLGCCHGGQVSAVIDAHERYSADISCDGPKADNNWDALILNPLTIPPSPLLFSYERTTGSMSVNHTACAEANIQTEQANNTVVMLNLNAERLKKMRMNELTYIGQKIADYIKSGLSPEDARLRIAQAMMRKNVNGDWPRFFSAVRSYLGSAAEENLRQVGYL
ncbi:retron system putative HNH endonuclease [Serratia nevei]|uniref:retron system putative HNH endonuclease n=1 Tax=Serratia nevei TaxID=2703794 RepID=UPI00301A4182